MGFGASKVQKVSVKEENVNSSAGANPSGSENQVYIIRKKLSLGINYTSRKKSLYFRILVTSS